jgi:hypothetical protein
VAFARAASKPDPIEPHIRNRSRHPKGFCAWLRGRLGLGIRWIYESFILRWRLCCGGLP